ncbi:Ldh family oxidoreductase [Bradyrhizobium sp. U87765 SZCCT0131]|uniref:Ldh family oxidoreductase n=1 Tax=unclassified Bradyrhizobium TaxID=2631580 RepID=UPI001BA4D1C2|nr:Ldh family oxidoreductase [Bradyrhizobium sp. U87765 SZCCT0131]MBR1259184.1 Ldh family oxidoreductase [Bradyrhizobium sp. U87765 SZCCT0134]MBR1305325.1 Ldh family oxidoreductase [Bradyrhizobium sp. U87765 SZCCT0110]MBR1321111.1 Ldh family oxidoreductase [Bradyrhizobium sp. U87765 SZCCT0109]MBR1350235.1 Ldh family oxidoreductase [Bradyrhizobium sp. U87765 SZCCT0048]
MNATAPTSDTLAIDAAHAERFLTDLFARGGLSPAAAREMAEALIDADRSGLPSHGLSQAEMYLRRLQLGSVSTLEEPDVIDSRAATAVLDARGMFGHLAGRRAMAIAIERSNTFGVGVVAVRNSFHFGAAGRYARQASAHDCIGLAMCNTKPMMPAPGGLTKLVGNNPLAVGLPAATNGPDFLLDMALSEAALGKIRAYERRGEPLPAGWAVDADGQPTTDPTAAIAGMLLPAGGAKGFGLALAIDLMCSLLAEGPGGDAVPPLYGDLAKPFVCSLLFIAIDIAHFRDPGDFRGDAAAALSRIRTARTNDDPLRTPGERSWAARNGTDALRIPRALATALDRFAAEMASAERLQA